MTVKISRTLAVVAVLAVLGVGCGSSNKTSASSGQPPEATATAAASTATTAASTAAAPAATAAPAVMTAAATTAAPASGQAADKGVDPATGLIPPAPVDRKIATTTSVDMQVHDVGDADLKIRTFVEGAGGYISAQQTSLGPNPTATLVAKIPPSKLSGLMTVISNVGKVTARGQQADDVTAQYVDLEARITSQRASVDRMRELYAKAETVDELAKAEGELTRRQTDLEQLLGQKRVLDGRVDLATLTISLHPYPEVVPPTTTTTTTVKAAPSIHGAFGKSAKSMGKFGSLLLYVFLVLLPWLLAAAAITTPIVLFARRQNRRQLDKAAARLAATAARDTSPPSAESAPPSAPMSAPMSAESAPPSAPTT